jgi:membrane-bound lytic murein transglycosylase A
MTSFSSQTLSESLAFLEARSILLEPCSFSDLNGWTEEEAEEAFLAFVVACMIQCRSQWRVLCPGRPFLEPLSRLQKDIAALFPPDLLEGESWHDTIKRYGMFCKARVFFETYFRPYRIAHTLGSSKLITAYFEPEYIGRSIPCGNFTQPLLGLPRGWPKNHVLPSRRDIQAGALKPYSEVLAYLNPVDAYMAHVQGSARIWVADQESFLRLIYAGKNGHPYQSLARIVMETSSPSQPFMAAPELISWAHAHPEAAAWAMDQNPSYVFFQTIEDFKADHSHSLGPIGGAGIPLIPGRSCAVDSSLWPYGLPFWVQPSEPLIGYDFPRLLFAHDTGSAICGPERFDIFFGTGQEWGAKAGRICHSGSSLVFLPRDGI